MNGINPAPHRRSRASTDTWITPEWLIRRCGPFDLDPCAAPTMPWPTARVMLTEADDGLASNWGEAGARPLVWLNPPYGRRLGKWLEKMICFEGIALTFARTDTRAFHDYVWPFATAMLFLRGRVTFCQMDGTPAPNGHNSGGPSVLIAYGARGAARLYQASLKNPDATAVVRESDPLFGKLVVLRPSAIMPRKP